MSNKVTDSPIFSSVRQLKMMNSSVLFRGFPEDYSLFEFVGDLDEELIAYKGSLSIPPCSPASWIVAKNVRKISVKDVRIERIEFWEEIVTILSFSVAELSPSFWNGGQFDCAQLPSSAEETQTALFGVLIFTVNLIPFFIYRIRCKWRLGNRIMGGRKLLELLKWIQFKSFLINWVG